MNSRQTGSVGRTFLRRFLPLGLALLLAQGFTAPLRAQAVNGTVTGVVSDAAAGNFLEGAEVVVAGTDLHVATARDGTFTLAGVPLGDRSIIISYPGLETQLVPLNVGRGVNPPILARLLTGEVLQMDKMTVSGTKMGMSQAVALQKISFQSKLVAAADQFIEERRKKSQRPGKKPAHLFSGIAVCSCGAKMYVPSNSPKYICSKCRNKIPAEDLEAIFYDELKAFFCAPEKIAGHLEDAQKNIVEKERLVTMHQREVQKVRGEMARTHRLYLDGQIPLESFGSYHRPMEERLRQLEAELPRMEAEVDHLKVNGLSADEVLTEAKTLYGRWPQLPAERKRQIIESIVERITIGGGEIQITLSYLPSSEELTNSQQRLRARWCLCFSP